MKKLILITFLLLTFCLIVLPQNEIKNEDLIISKDFLDAQRKDLNGKTFRIGARTSKYKILLVWATWSDPCLVVLEKLSKISQEFDKYNVEIFGLTPTDKENQTKDLRNAKRHTKRFKTKFTNSITIEEEIVEIMDKLKVKGIPLMILINEDGKILKHFVGTNYRNFDRLKAELENPSTVNK